ncbi:MAG: hypothetical protein QMD85_03535 [Candidatus Aenigmarchaeota archaeon]|nr:hypothetical protein [Candidatus Aenigmarchaeota archaeon]MDI6722618.1 hypothetical protein [Candidatus Aenigmarchaeota archaeon]
MKIDRQGLARLSNLELRQYAGDLNAISGADRRMYNELMESLAEMRLTADRGLCDDGLYEICASAQGWYEKFEDLRRAIVGRYTKDANPFQKMADTGTVQSPCLLSVLFDGVYVGDMEDLLNYRDGTPSGIFYPVQGLGEKIAEVEFLPEETQGENAPDGCSSVGDYSMEIGVSMAEL